MASKPHMTPYEVKAHSKKALSGVMQALHAGFEVSISTMIHRLNLRDLHHMKKLFQKLGIKKLDSRCSVYNRPLKRK